MRSNARTTEAQNATKRDRFDANADTDLVVRILNEIERAEFVGDEPNPGYGVFAMRRRSDMYDGGVRRARVSVHGGAYGDPVDAAIEFRNRYTEAFDQLLPPSYGVDEWVTIQRFLKGNDGFGLAPLLVGMDGADGDGDGVTA